VLLGGNLTMLATSAGSRHQPDLAGAILLLEEVNEEPYRVDRSIVQLRRSGWFEGLAGVAVGQFTGCAGADASCTVHDVLADLLYPLEVPVLAGLPVGHGTSQTAVPLGVPACLDAGARTLTVEPATR